MKRILGTVGAALALGVLLSVPAEASTAAAGCEVKYRTYPTANAVQVKCDTDGPLYEFRVVGQCVNGRRESGWVRANSGGWGSVDCGPYWIDLLTWDVEKRPV
jgi:hypothetical protein